MRKYSIAINIFERSQKSAITCTFEMIHVCSMEIFWEIFCHLWQKNQQRAISWAKKDTEWVPKTHFCWNQYVISHFEFMLIIIFLSDFEDRKQWHNLPWFLRKIKVQKINALYLSVKVFSMKVLIGDTIFTSLTGDGTAILCGHLSHMKV